MIISSLKEKIAWKQCLIFALKNCERGSLNSVNDS
jgi:hypothetical protein